MNAIAKTYFVVAKRINSQDQSLKIFSRQIKLIKQILELLLVQSWILIMIMRLKYTIKLLNMDLM